MRRGLLRHVGDGVRHGLDRDQDEGCLVSGYRNRDVGMGSRFGKLGEEGGGYDGV